MRQSKDKPEEKISAVNIAIDAFFRDCACNEQKTEWFSPSVKIVPPALREISTSLSTFFKGRSWSCGGPIPEELIYTKRNFRLINNIALVDALDLAYDRVGKCRHLAKTSYRKNVEVGITLKTIKACHDIGIPRDYVGGLLLLYLELCEKVEL